MSEKKPLTYWKVKKSPDGKFSKCRGRVPKGFESGYATDMKGTGFDKDMPKGAIVGKYKNAPRSPKSYIKKAANVGPVELTAVQHIQEARKTATKRIAQIEKEIASLNAELKQLQAIATL